MHIHGCSFLCRWTCVHVFVTAWMWRQESASAAVLQKLSILILRQGSHRSEAHQVGLAGWSASLRDLPVLTWVHNITPGWIFVCLVLFGLVLSLFNVDSADWILVSMFATQLLYKIISLDHNILFKENFVHLLRWCLFIPQPSCLYPAIHGQFPWIMVLP